MENIDPNNEMRVYYQINYTLTEVPEDAAYFHAQFRRSNPNINSDHVLVDGIKGKGQYVGTYIAWQVNNNGWWGEGEIKSPRWSLSFTTTFWHVSLAHT